MYSVHSEVLVAAAKNPHPEFAAGVEAALVFNLLQTHRSSEEREPFECTLLASNRQVFKSFAGQLGYECIIFKDISTGHDRWRFIKKEKECQESLLSSLPKTAVA